MKKMFVIRINFYAGMGNTATTFLSNSASDQRWIEDINKARVFDTREEAEKVLEKERARAPKVKDMEVREVRPTKFIQTVNKLREI